MQLFKPAATPLENCSETAKSRSEKCNKMPKSRSKKCKRAYYMIDC